MDQGGFEPPNLDPCRGQEVPGACNALTIRPLAHCLCAFGFPVLHFVHEFSRATLGLKVCVCTPCLVSGALLSPSFLLYLCRDGWSLHVCLSCFLSTHYSAFDATGAFAVAGAKCLQSFCVLFSLGNVCKFV